MASLSMGTEMQPCPIDLEVDLWRASFTSYSVNGRMEKSELIERGRFAMSSKSYSVTAAA